MRMYLFDIFIYIELNEEPTKIDKIDLLDYKFFHLFFW